MKFALVAVLLLLAPTRAWAGADTGTVAPDAEAIDADAIDADAIDANAIDADAIDADAIDADAIDADAIDADAMDADARDADAMDANPIDVGFRDARSPTDPLGGPRGMAPPKEPFVEDNCACTTTSNEKGSTLWILIALAAVPARRKRVRRMTGELVDLR